MDVYSFLERMMSSNGRVHLNPRSSSLGFCLSLLGPLLKTWKPRFQSAAIIIETHTHWYPERARARWLVECTPQFFPIETCFPARVLYYTWLLSFSILFCFVLCSVALQESGRTSRQSTEDQSTLVVQSSPTNVILSLLRSDHFQRMLTRRFLIIDFILRILFLSVSFQLEHRREQGEWEDDVNDGANWSVSLYIWYWLTQAWHEHEGRFRQRHGLLLVVLASNTRQGFRFDLI